MKMCQHVMDLQLCPLDVVLKRVLDRLMRKDPANIFAQPVSVEDVSNGGGEGGGGRGEVGVGGVKWG